MLLVVLAAIASVQVISILMYGPRAKTLADQEVNEMSRSQSVMVDILGNMEAANSLGSAALTPVQQIGMNLQVIQTVRVHLNRLHDLVDEEQEDTHPDGVPADLSQALVLENVSYSYSNNGQKVLSDVNLTIRPGELLAVVGPSGSGKSTLSRLCLGLIDPVCGQVRLGKHPLEEIDLRSMRRQTGIVTQGATGSAGSIRANVRAGRQWVSDADIVRALKAAALDEDVSRMPLGLDTPLGESGQGLSGGQLQRLAIARAVAGRPAFVIFDEATSSLDGPAEAVVYDALSTLDATRIVIAHRLSTVVHADRILFLVDGRVAALGPHEELLLSCPGYAEFVRSQMAWGADPPP
ncbi:ATP-binding cassette domain-containing protein [Actinomyces wuliandei]|uniref:ATP-binding cassette domain-containing protein n=1 Tax=Actinomyces wuliandei TaxID=2057743 RepID=UPI00111A9E68|nr:ATP-binding cassette domain-containing protein [Actinomyces wuliandei]